MAGLQDELDALDGVELSDEQRAKLDKIKSLASQRGLYNIPPNPKNEAISQGHPVTQIGAGLGETITEVGAGARAAYEGAKRGQQLGAPFGLRGRAIGGVIGAITGAGAGQATAREGLLRVEEATGARPPMSMEQHLSHGLKAFGEGAVGEAFGRGVPGAITGGRNMVRRMLGGANDDALKQFDEAAQYGVHMTPGKLGDSRAGAMIESRLRKSLPGAGKFNARDVLNEENFKRAVQSDAQTLWGAYKGEHAEGTLIQKALENEAIPEWKMAEDKLYKDLRDATEGRPLVPTQAVYEQLGRLRESLVKKGSSFQPIVSSLDEVMERISKKGGVTGLTVEREVDPIIKTIPGKTNVNINKDVTQPSLSSPEQGLKPYDKGFVTPEETQLKSIHTDREYIEVPVGEQLKRLKVTEKSDAPRQAIPIDFMTAHEARQVIGREMSNRQLPLGETDQKALKAAYKLLSDAMNEGALAYKGETGKDVSRLWTLADKATVKGKELFNESIVRNALDSNPEKLVELAFKKDAETQTRDLVKALDLTKDGVARYQHASLEWLLKEATQEETGRISGKKFARLANARGEAVLKETFQQHYPNVKKWIDMASKMDEAAKGEAGGILLAENSIVFSTPFAAGTALATGHPGIAALTAAPAVLYVMTANQLAKTLTDPKKARTLFEIAKTSPQSQKYASLVGQLASMESGEMAAETFAPSEPPVPFGMLSRANAVMNQR